jgi:uncharacterized protein (TIGR03437 family)
MKSMGHVLILTVLLLFSAFTISPAYAQTQPVSGSCVVTAVPNQVRAEGITERMGDILLQCSGSNPGTVLAGNLMVYLPVSITNRVNTSNQTTDALSVDYGNGFVPTGIAGLVTGPLLAFNGISLTVPPSGKLTIKISGIRGNASQVAGGLVPQPIQAQLSFSAPASIPANQSLVTVAYPQTGLEATLNSAGITCVGSPLPSTYTLSNLFSAGTAFSSTRLTEGFAASFQPRQPGEDNGTRFLIKYSDFPANAQLYIPDFVAGSSAAVPTAGGDLGVPQNVGQYVPGSGTLLLARVQYTDSSGAGGYLAQLPPGGGSLNSVSAVALTGGVGYAVYEVVDASPALQESVQFPTFIGLSNVTSPALAQESASLAPVSAVQTSSTSAPITRFAPVTPRSDCSVIGDCSAGYFPHLNVPAAPIKLSAVAGADSTGLAGYIPVQNSGGGSMPWNATVIYASGTNWLNLSSSSGQNYGSIMVTATAKNLAAGTYQASVTIDAGAQAGNASVPVTFTVQPAPPSNPTPTTPAIVISKVVNAATFDVTPLVAGSLGTLMGSHFSGKSVAVTFDGVPASLLYTSDTQINLQVPAGVAGKTSSIVVVTADGQSSAPTTVALAPAWPSVFANGVLNQDNSMNSANNGAKAGTILQVFATGIPEGAIVTAQIGNHAGLIPLYAGDAPTVAGVQQVNVAVPGETPSAATTLTICVSTPAQQYCSAGTALTVQ